MNGQKRKQLFNYAENDITSCVLLPHIEIERNCSVTVEGVKGILEYDGKIIKIDCGDISLKLEGDSMEIDIMLSERINICGNILSVEFFT